MDDIEITKRCAEASGVPFHPHYDPLTNDAQCFALVKRMRLRIDVSRSREWIVTPTSPSDRNFFLVENENLNRAICECVAKLAARGT